MAAKRFFDVLFSALALCVLLPLFILISIVIKVDTPGPVFFSGLRVGRMGKSFYMLKFRTMHNVKSNGSGITVKDDPRITGSGRWLRRLKLDELPQLINVIAGEMSLVGPRPEDPKYVGIYDSRQRQLLDYLPGITSPGSMLFRDESGLLQGDNWEELYCKEILPQKLNADLEYFERATLWSDLGIIARTAAVFVGRLLDSRPST
jgi:lipopolysaccharide/colanic/teichoic acid biosynthesis glycosyltransferase